MACMVVQQENLLTLNTDRWADNELLNKQYLAGCSTAVVFCQLMLGFLDSSFINYSVLC